MPTCHPTERARQIIRGMAKALLEDGLTDAHAIVDAIHARIRDFAPMDKGEIAAIVGGFEDIPKPKPTRSDLQERLMQLRRDLKAAYGKGPDALKNERRQAQIRKDIAAINERIAKGDFAKPQRVKLIYDEATHKLQVELEAARMKADEAVRKLEFQTKSPLQKGLILTAGVQRAAILAGLSVFEHLAGASAWRLVSTLVEDAFWGVGRHLPGLRRLDELAEMEGGGLGLGTHARGLRNAFLADAEIPGLSKNVLREMWDKLARGASDRTLLYGKVHESPYPWLEYIGRTHDMIKTPIERYAFTRAAIRTGKNLRRQMARQGKSTDVIEKALQTDSAQVAIYAKAYEESQAAKLQGKNAVADAYQRGLRNMERSGDIGAVAAAIARTETPIVKIPINLARETASYVPGGGAAMALSKARSVQQRVKMGGISMTPEEADYIVRSLKKQAVGIGLGTIGFLFYQNFGGLYRPSHKPPTSERGYGDMKIGDFEVSHHLTHSAFVNAMQMGAMVHYVMGEDRKWAASHGEVDSEWSDVLDGITQAIGTVVYDLPFIDPVKQLEKATSGRGSEVAGDKLRQFIPAEINKRAREGDIDPKTGKPTKRYPRGIKEELELAIPGLREKVSSTPPRKKKTEEVD